MPRMHILTTAEHEAFDTPPVFSYAERDKPRQNFVYISAE
jgi:hypothetical protein